MRSSAAIAVTVVVFQLGVVSIAQAAEPYVGKWAMSAASCKSEPLFTIGERSFNGLTLGCKSASYAKDGEGWKGLAKACETEGEDGKPKDLAFRLIIQDSKLQVLWSDGTKSGKLIKCN